jgi:hypothetical protein
MPAQVREPGLVRREAGAVWPQREEQHPGEPLVALGQLVVRRTVRVGQPGVRLRPLSVVHVGQCSHSAQQRSLVRPGRRRREAGLAA